jgi:hypothetical protein
MSDRYDVFIYKKKDKVITNQIAEAMPESRACNLYMLMTARVNEDYDVTMEAPGVYKVGDCVK